MTSDENVLEELEALLGAEDQQTRLNAAVRLAYVGNASGLDALLDGLSHGVVAIRFSQVPEALSLLGDAAVGPLEVIARRAGPAQVPAARALTLRGDPGYAVPAIAQSLSSADVVERGMAVALAGELGRGARHLFDDLEGPAMALAPFFPQALSALVAVDRHRAVVPIVSALADEDASIRTAAMRATAALGVLAVDAAPVLRHTLMDGDAALRERLAAASALIRVVDGSAAASVLMSVVESADRWTQVGALRQLARLGPRFRTGRLPPDAQWEAVLVDQARPQPMDEQADVSTAGKLADLLDHDDYDARRNAALALALWVPVAPAIAGLRRANRLEDGLRCDVLRLYGQSSDAPRDGGVLWMTAPPIDHDSISEQCEAVWSQAGGGQLRLPTGVAKWELLDYLVARHDVLLHGSRTGGLTELRPTNQSATGARTASQPGVFAVDGALMAMYFGIIDRAHLSYLSNAISFTEEGGRRTPRYRLGGEFIGLAHRPFTSATVYVLPPDTFAMDGEWTSLVPVRPLACLDVEPSDFPLLEHLWGSDVTGLEQQFSDDYPYLRDVGFWATKRSAYSATTP